MPARTVRWSVSAVVLVAAGMALTACGPDDTTADPSPSASTGRSVPAPAPSASATSGTGGATSSPTASAQGQGGGGSGSSACQTANLSFSTSHGMGEGEVLINLKNSGSSSCSMHGFPGVDLKGQYGTVSATRSAKSGATVTLAPGQTAYVTLHYPPNTSGGSGVTFTSLVVTPPNTFSSHTMPVGINVPAGDSSAPTITVDPVGTGK